MAHRGRRDPDALTFVEHLAELRVRLFVCVLALAGGAAAGWLLRGGVLQLAEAPAKAAGVRQFVLLRPAEAFYTLLKLSLMVGVVLALPVVLYELGAFVWPGLRPREKRFVLWILPAVLLLFLSGVAFAYFVLLPYVMQFFLQFGGGELATSLSLEYYINFLIALLLPFGAVFQMPVLAALLGGIGVLTPRWLARNRKYAVLLIFIAAAVLTPPDPFSQLVLAFPMWALYELSIWTCRLAARSAPRGEAGGGAGGAPGA